MNSISSATKSSFTPGNQVSNRDKEIQGLMQQKIRLDINSQLNKVNQKIGDLVKEIHQPVPKEPAQPPISTASGEEELEASEGNKAGNKDLTVAKQEAGKPAQNATQASPAASYPTIDIRI